jgi:hypothetical protein
MQYNQEIAPEHILAQLEVLKSIIGLIKYPVLCVPRKLTESKRCIGLKTSEAKDLRNLFSEKIMTKKKIQISEMGTFAKAAN